MLIDVLRSTVVSKVQVELAGNAAKDLEPYKVPIYNSTANPLCIWQTTLILPFFNAPTPNVQVVIALLLEPSNSLITRFLFRECPSALARTRKLPMHPNQVCCTLPQGPLNLWPVSLTEPITGQEKQAKLLASDTGHFSMIRFGLVCLLLQFPTSFVPH